MSMTASAPFSKGDSDVAVAYISAFILVFFVSYFFLSLASFLSTRRGCRRLPFSRLEAGALSKRIMQTVPCLLILTKLQSRSQPAYLGGGTNFARPFGREQRQLAQTWKRMPTPTQRTFQFPTKRRQRSAACLARCLYTEREQLVPCSTSRAISACLVQPFRAYRIQWVGEWPISTDPDIHACFACSNGCRGYYDYHVTNCNRLF